MKKTTEKRNSHAPTPEQVKRFVEQVASGSVTVFAEKMAVAKSNTKKAFQVKHQ